MHRPPNARRGVDAGTGWEYPRFPRTSLEPDASLYRLNLCSAVG